MFLRANKREKDGKEHRYWSVVENRRVAGGRSIQKTLLYLAEIKDLHKIIPKTAGVGLGQTRVKTCGGFGDCITIDDIQCAVAKKTTMPIYYESPIDSSRPRSVGLRHSQREIRCHVCQNSEHKKVKKSGCPTWIRTMNNGSKGRCVTVTPSGKTSDTRSCISTSGAPLDISKHLCSSMEERTYIHFPSLWQ